MRDPDSYDIETDGKVVWINDATGLIGRFSRLGIDVHVDGHCQGQSCIPGPFAGDNRVAAWASFKAKMLALHAIEVSDQYKPQWCA